MFAHQRLQLLAAGAIAMATFVTAQNVRAENWTYRADLGGWLDNETGLVWGPTSLSWFNGGYSFDAAMYYATHNYRALTGNPKWRLPTLAEYQTAYTHNGFAYFSQSTPTGGFYSWTSDTQGKKQAWSFAMGNGKSLLTSKASGLYFRPVYRP